MRVRKNDVPLYWGDGKYVQNTNQTMTIWENGDVYSYSLLIGYIKHGKRILTPSKYSVTTTRHINLMRRTADVVKED